MEYTHSYQIAITFQIAKSFGASCIYSYHYKREAQFLYYYSLAKALFFGTDMFVYCRLNVLD